MFHFNYSAGLTTLDLKWISASTAMTVLCAIRYAQYTIRYASVAELADAPGLGPGVRYGRGGSSPLARSFW